VSRDVVAVDLPQGTERWLALRRARLGASEAGAIAGIDRYKRPGQVWAAKLGLWRPVKRELWHEIGHLLERPVADLWARDHQAVLHPGPVLTERSGRLLASLDLHGRFESGARFAEDTKVRFVEVAADGDLWGPETFPEAIRRQLLQGADLLERATGHRIELGICVALLIDRHGPKLRHYVVERTPVVREWWSDLVAPAMQDWWGWVDARRPPPDATIDDVAAVAATATEVVERTPSDDDLALVAELAEARAALKAATVARRAAKDREAEVASRVARVLGPDSRWPGVAAWAEGARYTRPEVEITEKSRLVLFPA